VSFAPKDTTRRADYQQRNGTRGHGNVAAAYASTAASSAAVVDHSVIVIHRHLPAVAVSAAVTRSISTRAS
jgi:hypothetical protein